MCDLFEMFMLMTFNTFSEVSIADLLDEQVLLPGPVHALSLAAACAATEVWFSCLPVLPYLQLTGKESSQELHQAY